MRSLTALAVAVVLFVLGLVLDSTVLALSGFFGGIAAVTVAAAAAGGEWLRDASAGRFRRDGR